MRTTSPRTAPVRPGFTLVELLVVIAIIGVLVGLTIPAIQYAREQARKATCKNNLKQIYLANQSFLGLHNKFPSGGWGFGWVGDPKQPVGEKQPGGFFYSILPYMERQGLYEMSKAETDPTRVDALQYEMVNEYIPGFTCPSRRDVKAYDAVPKSDWGTDWLANAGQATPPTWYRSDYSVNGGTVPVLWDYGPTNPAQARLQYSDRNGHMLQYKYQNPTTGVNGIAHQYSEITTQDIFDGASNTYLVGEKYLNQEHYEDGVDTRDDHPAYGGDVRDLFSFANAAPRRDELDPVGTASPLIFGSVHDGTFHVVMCDGAVSEISYDIDMSVHAQNANRRDSRP
jgi:prepilin-type N-terminal cleavage/methylation domain-containing protein